MPVIASVHELVGIVSAGDVFRFNLMNDNAKGHVLRNHYRDSCGQEINEKDLRTWVKDADKNCTVHQIMTPQVIAVEKDASLEDVTDLLLTRHIHLVFVTEEKRIIGVITAMDALRAFSSM